MDVAKISVGNTTIIEPSKALVGEILMRNNDKKSSLPQKYTKNQPTTNSDKFKFVISKYTDSIEKLLLESRFKKVLKLFKK